MPLSWNEIRNNAVQFSQKWADEQSEEAEAKSFWDDFFTIFGLTRKRIASFEEPVKKLGDKKGFIDLFWKGMLLVEHKSRGKSLEKAYTQALDYFPGIAERDLPKYILVSDFARFRLYDLEAAADEPAFVEFPLTELHQHIHLFGFVAGYQVHKFKEQDPVNVEAAERMGKLHDLLKESGYTGYELELYLVRLLFCLFAEDTSIFEPQQFQELIEQRTHEDGSDLGGWLARFFQTINQPAAKRQKILDEQLAAFPYVNGKLFAEHLPLAEFNRPLRQLLLEACALDWSRISPAIFGSLFQSIMDKEARRNLGAHYTSEKNILKVIKPLFLDDLWAEFNKLKSNKNRLAEFHKKLRTLKFLDPACGCGNFLVVAYRELRELELEVLKGLYPNQMTLELNLSALVQVNVDQFFGIEIEEFPAQIAQVALWLVDHQMNMKVSQQFGQYFTRIPLYTGGNIVHGNALELDWQELVPASELHYIMGNPPFLGKQEQSKAQKDDFALAMQAVSGNGVLDFVAAWYVKAAAYMKGSSIRCAFVSTNSITQGEQVGVLWQWMLNQGVKIFFAHRTFQWSNEGRGKAAVHCVIIGFALEESTPKWLFEYQEIKGEPHGIQSVNINPYLVNSHNILLQKRSKPICDVPLLSFGNMPNDGGYLLLDDHEKEQLLQAEPQAKPFVKRFISADEFINGLSRWCLWLVDVSPKQLQNMPQVLHRVKQVKKLRLASSRAGTQKLALTPSLFGEIRQPNTNYLLLPRHSSENRVYVPFGFFDKDHIVADSCLALPLTTLYHFGVLTSLMHNAWMRTVCGRLESRYRYSVSIVYNNFPWPLNPTAKQQQAIEEAAQGVLDARALFPEATLADLYDPLTMPPALLKAHQKLDKAVDRAYGRTEFKSEAERVAFLFELYQKYTSLFPAEKPTKRRKKA